MNDSNPQHELRSKDQLDSHVTDRVLNPFDAQSEPIGFAESKQTQMVQPTSSAPELDSFSGLESMDENMLASLAAHLDPALTSMSSPAGMHDGFQVPSEIPSSIPTSTIDLRQLLTDQAAPSVQPMTNARSPLHSNASPVGTGSPPRSTNEVFDVQTIRADFPILHQEIHGKPLIWFDNAATTQKPQSVIDAISGYYQRDNSNVHRGAHTLAARSTDTAPVAVE